MGTNLEGDTGQDSSRSYCDLRQGAYSSEEQNLIYTVITFRELPQLKRLVDEFDPEALIVVTDTLEVMG